MSTCCKQSIKQRCCSEGGLTKVCSTNKSSITEVKKYMYKIRKHQASIGKYSLFVFTVTDCRRPPDLSYGWYRLDSENSTVEGSTVTYRCHAGYDMSGNMTTATSVCQENQNWSPVGVTCIRKSKYVS